MVCKRERKNKKYEPITNPASKTSNVEQGVEMSTMATDNTVVGRYCFSCHSNLHNTNTCA
jgi:hypothetical protein